ncbi:MAG: hypothetical protein ACOVP5_04550 [Chitinophagales bacterium]
MFILNLTEAEISTAPKNVQDLFESIPMEFKEKVEITEEGLTLAQTYVHEKVVGETSLDDYIHIATATLSIVDVLISWNFKHIVNIYRIRGYNFINLREGLQNLNIHSPKEIVGYDH